MAWNDDGNGKDPWRRDGDQPNDLDQIVQEWQKKFSRILGGSGGGGGGSGTGGVILAVLLLGAWLLTGFYRVDEAERGVVQRFGAFTETSLPGLRWHLPYPIETVDLVNTTAISNYAYRTEMLTADEQYVFIDMVVQFRREDPVKYSFEVVDPDMTLQDVTESALREVVGTTTLEQLVTARRDEIASRTQQVLQDTMDMYGNGTGIAVTSISLETVNYPQAVQAAPSGASSSAGRANQASEPSSANSAAASSTISLPSGAPCFGAPSRGSSAMKMSVSSVPMGSVATSAVSASARSRVSKGPTRKQLIS